MNFEEFTKPCVGCNKLMVVTGNPGVYQTRSPQYQLMWECFGCGAMSYELYTKPTDQERWEKINYGD